MNRREFLGAASGAAAIGILGNPARAEPTPPQSRRPVLMNVGHQHDHSEETLKLLAALGVNHICSGLPSPRLDEAWSREGLLRLRERVEAHGIALDAVPLPMSSSPIAKAEYPEILLAKDPDRDRAIDAICTMIRNAGEAGIPMVKYNMTFLGVVRSGSVSGRGGAAYKHFVYDPKKATESKTIAGDVGAEECWARIEYFLRRVVPVAESAKVRIALHPNDPGLPQDRPYMGVHSVLSSVAGLKRFVDTVPSPYHGLNFCQGTICEMLEKPNEEIFEVIRYFGERKKIFNVHFRNISGGFLNFRETFPDNGDVDMPRALAAYQDVGFSGMVMPDHVPTIDGDQTQLRAFSFCFGYIQALLQTLRAHA